MSNKNTVSSTKNTESWASSVSDYILKRREQTLLAYTDPNSLNQSNANSDAWLFKTLFIILAEQLEEGHTVLTLSSGTNNLSENDAVQRGTVKEEKITLFDWQQYLLEMLALPLFDLIDDGSLLIKEENIVDQENVDQKNSDITGAPNLSISSIENPLIARLNILFKQGAKLWWQLSLLHHERHLLNERYELVEQLYALFNQINQSLQNQDSPDSLSSPDRMDALHGLNEFISVIESHSLMTAMIDANSVKSATNIKKVNNVKNTKNSLSNLKNNKQNPIIYKVINESNKQSQTVDITFWLHRTWQAEHALAQRITSILSHKVTPLPLSIPDTLNEQQVNAINIANNNAFSIITGGPGTGKTYTVAQLVIALHQANVKNRKKGQQPVKFSTDSATLTLAAPTGKAAQRMQESLQAAINDADVDIKLEDAKTIHRLLGIGRDGRPRYNADNPLGEDVIIVDEASMLGVELANYLVSSIKRGARLILLGDANQLAAVDAGAVLADLRRIPLLQPIHATLTESRRFDKDSGIGKLATLINEKHSSKNIKAMWQLLKKDDALSFEYVNTKNDNSNQGDGLKDSNAKNSLSNDSLLLKICANYQPYLDKVKQAFLNTNKTNTESKDTKIEAWTVASDLINTLNQFRVLTAGHHGQWGDDYINDYLSNWHITQLKLPLGKSPWYHGRPVMILHNSYELGLFNGDIGVCLQVAGSNKLEVFFENKIQGIAVNLLNDDLITTAYAMTIHKSQGSEFDHVTITFDSSHSRLLSKELIYTAVTRAKKQVTIYSTQFALEQAVTTPTVRQTGLALQFD